ncbi:hypothetical protein RJ53_03125 [Methanocalculus chunghsingensis]|uniref:Tetratricopeptide repeat protein n=1 Tax=Methanocalculus chunghsingensis TaxID=156457 RepID=A0A8J7W597_9EURY|nr:hypothetical protein [Methanocalculus chunghsingensis]MBR1368549.1 hypothetical protein [Methanocalculus chunghsingensis]
MMNGENDTLERAFHLHEAGMFEESLALCQERGDPAYDILAAENLASLGRLSEAKAAYLDLIRSVPGSARLHRGLARVLELQGDASAFREYMVAVRLDPGDRPALTRYAALLTERGDHRAAIPVLKILLRQRKDLAALPPLIASLIAIGEGEEAIALYNQYGSGDDHLHLYIEALIACGRYEDAADLAGKRWVGDNDSLLRRLWLSSLSKIRPDEAYTGYLKAIEDGGDPELIFEAALLAKQLGYVDKAGDLLQQLLADAYDPIYHLAFCDLLARSGSMERASEEFSRLVSSQLGTLEDPDSLILIIRKYIWFLLSRMPEKEAVKQVNELLAPHPAWFCLIPLGEMYEQLGDHVAARDACYRGYRSDYIRGGLAYAAYLARVGDERESEKVMLYILSHLSKVQDLEMVAGAIVHGEEKLYRKRRISSSLQQRLLKELPSLSAEGREILAVTSLYAASGAVDEGDYQACKEHCLTGLDVMPCYPSSIRIEDFIPLLGFAKEHALTEDPVMLRRGGEEKEEEIPLAALLHLDEREEKAVDFIRKHTETHEMELRTLLGTRRVAGIINGIIRKAGDAGLSIIERRGMSEHGEVYAWIGT